MLDTFMTRLDRYIGASVLASLAVVLAIVIGLDVLFAMLDQLEQVNERYTMASLLEYLLLTTPKRFYDFIPLSCLVGCLIGLGSLASGSELTVMRAAGVSIGRIVLAVLKPIVLLGVFTVALGEYVVPYTEPLAESRRAVKVSDGAITSGYGIWHRESDEFIHINAVLPDGSLKGVTRYRFDKDDSLISSSYAVSGNYANDTWLLNDVRETQFHEDSTEANRYETQNWDVKLTPQRLSVIVVEPDELPISGLLSYSSYLREQGLETTTYMLAFWSKLFQPLSMIALVLIAISFIFGPLRSVTTGQRVISGVVVGVMFKFAQDLLAPISTLYSIAPFWAALMPILLCALVGGWLLRRAG
ncbi:LPS export ABC transporter permease LptG [Aliamphritea ceti]|uniref:LPS export ABC transporter permease LptG n=1 Tax=Aliamphritea ceti TaxID=1524258 RepID=UPI0021C29644|nr:LPS export ABC transporter permease LptG [Aliamphritea ceti]